MNGNITAVIVKATVVMARFETEKFRSRNSRRGTSGSVRIRDCHQRKMPSRATPSPSSKGTEIGPRITPQSYAWPSWIAKTAQNRPTALSATPTQSKLCAWVASRGTSRAASTKPMIPTGTLMKKIHSQPGPSSRTPAEDRADERGDAGGRAPQRHGAAAPLGSEGSRDDRHRLRGHHGGAEPLHHAGRDEHPDAAGEFTAEATPQGSDREDSQPLR